MAKHILLVDDEEAIVRILTIILEREGFVINAKSNTADVFTQPDPDLFLLDLILKGEDGMSLIRKLKSDKKRKKTPIIAFSAMPTLRTAALEAGADTFIEKPYDIDELVNLIHQMV